MKVIIRILIALDIVLYIATAFFYSVLYIDRNTQYEIVYKTSGESMLPTINDKCVIITYPTPFEELQVGDIIDFREDKTDEARKSYDNGTDKPSGFTNMTVPPHTYMENPPYDRDVGIEYVDGVSIIHRIIEIREADENFDRALFTQGDNNPEREFRSVMESGYKAKVIHIIPFGSELLKRLYDEEQIIGLLSAAFFLMLLIGGLILLKDHISKKSCQRSKPRQDRGINE